MHVASYILYINISTRTYYSVNLLRFFGLNIIIEQVLSIASISRIYDTDRRIIAIFTIGFGSIVVQSFCLKG